MNIECKVRDVLELGSHHMFLADVTAVRVDGDLVDESGKLRLDRANLVAYSHGEYFALGRRLGTFGYSVRKKPQAEKGRAGKPRSGKPRAGKPVPRRQTRPAQNRNGAETE